MSQATQNNNTPTSGRAIISYGPNLPALFRAGRPMSDSELVAAWAVQKSARDAEEAAADQRELAESRLALRQAHQRIAELARQVERLEKKLAPPREKAAAKTKGRSRPVVTAEVAASAA